MQRKIEVTQAFGPVVEGEALVSEEGFSPRYLKLGGREHLFDVVADPRERAELAEVFPDELSRLKRLYAAWSAQMLPYPADARSYDVHTGTADRY